MKYNYRCACGCSTQMETDQKPPLATKCYRCGKSVRREGAGSDEEEVA